MARILVVDDDPDLLRTVRRILEADDHEVSTAVNGKSALEDFAESAPELVISDVYMPEMDGIEFLIRLQAAFPGVKIVAMSGGGFKAKEDVLGTATALGAVATLEKPFTVEDLQGAVRAALGEEAAGGR